MPTISIVFFTSLTSSKLIIRWIIFIDRTDLSPGLPKRGVFVSRIKHNVSKDLNNSIKVAKTILIINQDLPTNHQPLRLESTCFLVAAGQMFFVN